jgi:hypothetical protein
MPRTATEAIGDYELRLTYDARGRLLEAVQDTMRLSLSPEVPSGTRLGIDGSETWRSGRVTGTWADLPYGHECDVDKAIRYDAWVQNVLRDFRGQVFFSYCPKGKKASPELAADALRYCIRHDVLSPHIGHHAAEAATRLAARVASAEELVEWRRYFEAHGLTAYVAALDAPPESPPRRRRKKQRDG